MQVSGWERTTLYGVVINPKRRIHYGPLAPAESREIFIRQGLVGEEIDEAFAKRWPFFQHNQKLIREIEHLEHKQRRQDVLVDDELIFAFYDSIIPEGIHNGATFDHWRKEAERENAQRQEAGAGPDSAADRLHPRSAWPECPRLGGDAGCLPAGCAAAAFFDEL
jgi:ATP-dependent helicase HrpA